MANEQKPSVGRIVHFGEAVQAKEFVEMLETRAAAAIITKVNADGTADLHIFYSGGATGWRTFVEYAETLAVDCWTWPPRVGADPALLEAAAHGRAIAGHEEKV